jgi:oligoribonuclease
MDWLLWIDLETTGLDAGTDRILQVACVLSNFDVSVCYPLPQITLNCDKFTLDQMNEWCTKQHTSSGLVEEVMDSTITVEEAEGQICLHLNNYLRVQDKLYLAGNSVHFDKGFIEKWMPKLAGRLSHRIVDVSSIDLICKHLNSRAFQFKPVKMYNHTAAADIHESIKEYQYFLSTFLRTSPFSSFNSI